MSTEQALQIENERLRQRITELEARLAGGQLAAVIEIEHGLAASLDQALSYEILRQGVHRLFPDVPSLLISSFDEERQMIRAEYVYSDGEQVDASTLPELPLAPPGQGTQSQVIHTRSPLVIDDDLEAKMRPGTVTRFGSDSGRFTRSAVLVPMLAQGKVLGVLWLQSYEPNRFSAEDVRALTLVANTAAVSIQNARLYEMARREIDERARAEAALRASEEQYRRLADELERRVHERSAEIEDLYENAPVGYHSLDAQGRYIRVNQTELNWLGYTREEMIGRPVTDFFTPASQALFQENFPLFKQRGWLKDLEIEFIRKDGTILPAALTATAVYDRQGQFVMSRSTLVDVSERRKIEQALRESASQNRLLFEESPDAVALVNERGQIIQANRACESLTGLAREKIIGRTFPELGLVPEAQGRSISRQLLRAVVRHEPLVSVEYTLQRPDGSQREVESRIFLLEIDGSPHALATTRDITAHKQAEEALRSANRELERAMRLKDEFLASMSHELRTPLSGILGICEGMQEEVYGSLTERQRRALGNIESSGRHLLDLINDILDVAKLEAGKVELEIEAFQLQYVCRAALQLVRGMAQKKGQKMTFSMSPPEIALKGDSRRIKQILVNLLSNAVKFTPEGGSLGLEVEGQSAEGVVHLTVWDKGIGIKAEDVEKLFQPFVQLDSSLARQQTGTGLGLTLVQHLTELHGGSVQVESIFGEGSRFTVTLPWDGRQTLFSPQPAPAFEEAPASADSQPPSAPAMVVDDNEVNLQTLADCLRARQFRVVTARSGSEFLERVAEVKPAVVLMDIQMPGMDGLEVIRRLRAHPDAGIAATPVLAVTALAMPGDGEKCLAAGANAYLSKPFRLREVIEQVQQLTRPTPSGAGDPSPTRRVLTRQIL